MISKNIYSDISVRCGGDVYIGVVGPVRTGKSTFITNFMQQLVLPNIENQNAKKRAIDELPQSADGKTVMTTSPHFVPNQAVKCTLAGNVKLNVRMVDCVGYMVSGATGIEEDGKPRLVKTPWSEKEIPFSEAGEIGTKKVICDHSTIAVAVTNDGTICDLGREAYINAEEKVVKQLKNAGKPFVLVVNSKNAKGQICTALCKSLSEKYSCKVIACDVAGLNKEDIDSIMSAVLEEFPVTSYKVKMPKWLQVLDFNNQIIEEVMNEVVLFTSGVDKIANNNTAATFADSSNFLPMEVDSVNGATGEVVYSIVPKPELYFKVLSIQSGQEISSDFELVSYLKTLSQAKLQHDKIKDALKDVDANGYGVVIPLEDEMQLEEPQIFKHGSKNGVKLRATAPSLHIMKVDVSTEVSPAIGTEQQSEEMLNYLKTEFENNKDKIWQTNIFGKSLHTVVKEGINNKVCSMPEEARKKIRRTVTKIVNDGKGGIICILL